jgi:hypothetical protein
MLGIKTAKVGKGQEEDLSAILHKRRSRSQHCK